MIYLMLLIVGLIELVILKVVNDISKTTANINDQTIYISDIHAKSIVMRDEIAALVDTLDIREISYHTENKNGHKKFN